MAENNYKATFNLESYKAAIMLKSLLIGAMSGFMVALFRFTLIHGAKTCFAVNDYVRAHLYMLPVLFIALAALGALVGYIVSLNNMASGSGIPQVMGIVTGYFKDNWLASLLTKFIGGALTSFGGLSVGREGPSIQIGAAVAEGFGEKAASSNTEKKILIASGAAAGLAAAFNAPLAGAVFALEEIYKYFSPVVLISTMLAAVSSDFVTAYFFNLEPIFPFYITGSIPLDKYWVLVILGAVLGAGGAVYNFVMVNANKKYKEIKRIPKIFKPVIPFMLAGVVGMLFPVALGTGQMALNSISVSSGITFLLILIAVKFVFSATSFASGAPGGIFFPLLVLGAVTGAIFGKIAVTHLGMDAALFNNFAVLGMAGFFAAVVRAPITGIILLVEMTGNFTELLSMTVVSIAAYFTADLLKSPPVYEWLLHNMIVANKIETEKGDAGDKVTVETVVQNGSEAEGKKLRELRLPDKCLLVSVKRNGRDFIPDGDFELMANDYLVFITSETGETRVRRRVNKITSCDEPWQEEK